MIIKRLGELLFKGAPRQQYYLELGAYLLRKGAGYEVGQIVASRKVCGKDRPVYIDNLFFDFKNNRINHQLSDKPVPVSPSGGQGAKTLPSGDKAGV